MNLVCPVNSKIGFATSQILDLNEKPFLIAYKIISISKFRNCQCFEIKNCKNWSKQFLTIFFIQREMNAGSKRIQRVTELSLKMSSGRRLKLITSQMKEGAKWEEKKNGRKKNIYKDLIEFSFRCESRLSLAGFMSSMCVNSFVKL